MKEHGCSKKENVVSQYGERYEVGFRAQKKCRTLPCRWQLLPKISSCVNAIRGRLQKICVFPIKLAARMHENAITMIYGYNNLHSTLPPQHHLKSFHKEDFEHVLVRLD